MVLLAGIAGGALGALMEWQLDDGLDIYYVVMEVEDEFCVKIPDWESIDTVDDLYQRTLGQLRNKGDADVDEQDVWRRLHALLVRQLGFRPDRVVRSARFYIDLPM